MYNVLENAVLVILSSTVSTWMGVVEQMVELAVQDLIVHSTVVLKLIDTLMLILV